MEIKKSKEADLENKVWVFRFLGLIMIASVVLMAFTFVVADPDEYVDDTKQDKMGEELVFELDIPEEEPEEEPEDEPPPPIIEETVVVDDEEEIEELDFGDLEVEEQPDDEPDDEIEVEAIIDFAEVEPEFPGGQGAMAQWLVDNIEYPSISIEMGEQGIVYVQFVVNKDGSIEQVKVLRGITDALDAEAKRVVKKMPRWAPGEQAGKKVRVRYTVPIHFKLG